MLIEYDEGSHGVAACHSLDSLFFHALEPFLKTFHLSKSTGMFLYNSKHSSQPFSRAADKARRSPHNALSFFHSPVFHFFAYALALSTASWHGRHRLQQNHKV